MNKREKEIKDNSNRFTYNSDFGLSIVKEEPKKNDIKKGEESDFTEDQLEELIKEHERVVEVLKPYAKMDEKVKKELTIQEEELKGYKEQLKLKDEK